MHVRVTEKIVKNILYTLKKNYKNNLVYRGDELVVHGYLDASFQKDIEKEIQSNYILI
jgi:hypothetical protein